MKQYIGTKMVMAAPAVRLDDGQGNVRIELLEHNPIPCAGDAVDMGYKVVYPDGYESFCPQDAFEKAYREADGMPFCLAIEAAKKGERIARKCWPVKHMYVFRVGVIEFGTNAFVPELANPEFEIGDIPEMLMLRIAPGTFQPGWLASQADMLADDWYIV